MPPGWLAGRHWVIGFKKVIDLEAERKGDLRKATVVVEKRVGQELVIFKLRSLTVQINMERGRGKIEWGGASVKKTGAEAPVFWFDVGNTRARR